MRSTSFSKGCSRLFVAALLLPTVVMVATTAPAAAQSGPPGPADGGTVTFDQAPPVGLADLPPIARDKLRNADRARFIEVAAGDVSSALSSSSSDATTVDLELFPDLVVALRGDGPPVQGQNGSTTWSGLGPKGEYATLTFIDGQVIGTAAVGGSIYDISPVSGGTHLVTEEGRVFPDEADPLPGGDGGGAGDKAPSEGSPGTGSPPSTQTNPVVDVLTWYDTAARTYFGGDAAAVVELTATVNEANAAYVRSGVNQSLRSVGIEYVAYAGTGAASTELNRWHSTSDGNLDSVHARRDTLGADLVSLVSPLSDACGIGYLGGPASGTEGFTVVDPGCARGNLTFAHELGHNMGAGHGDPDGGGLFTYSNGYRDIVNDFRTIMAYDSASCPGGSCPRVAYFSSPTVLYNGHATGSATQDNARTLNERSTITAAYRGPPTGVSGTVTESGSGVPVGGAFVAVLRSSDFSIAGGGVANGSGDFSALVPAGSYFLYVIDPAGGHTAALFGAPTQVTVTAGTMVDADPALASSRGSVTATVTETGTGTPIAGVWGLALSASPANTGATEAAVTANGAGQLTIPGLRAGNHYVGFIDPTGAHATRFFPNSPTLPGATPTAVTAGNATAANASLPTQTPVGTGSTISGTVTEAGTNAPLANGRVLALRAADYQIVRAAATNASGQYTLNLAAGDYKLAFLDATGGHDMEWFDNLPSTGLPSAVSVTAPGTANAALNPNTGTMAGTIIDDPAATPLAGAWAIAIGPTGIAGGAVTAANGTYTLGGLATGTYRATFVDPNGGRTQEYWDNSPTYAAATTFNITAANTTTINAALGYAPPPNDAFANAQVITGATGTASGTNKAATKEVGEPNHAGDAGGRSVWYRWTAPATGTATFNTCGSDFDTLLAAYTGTAVNALALVAGNDDTCGLQSQVSFAVASGVTYRIAVDGYAAATGTITLGWSLA